MQRRFSTVLAERNGCPSGCSSESLGWSLVWEWVMWEQLQLCFLVGSLARIPSLPLYVGSMISTVTEVQFSWTGLGMGMVCVVCSVMYQLYNAHLQNQHDIHPMLLLYYEAPYTVACAMMGAAALGVFRVCVCMTC